MDDKTMNDKTMNNAKVAHIPHPSFSFYHPNAKGTGAAAKFAMVPAAPYAQGGIVFSIAPQKGTAFDNEQIIAGTLTPVEVSEILDVMHGCNESVRDGKGIFHQSEKGDVVVRFSHRIEPVPGYIMDVNFKDKATEAERTVSIFFSKAEAFALSLAFEQSMKEMMFGESYTLVDARDIYLNSMAAFAADHIVKAEAEGESGANP